MILPPSFPRTLSGSLGSLPGKEIFIDLKTIFSKAVQVVTAKGDYAQCSRTKFVYRLESNRIIIYFFPDTKEISIFHNQLSFHLERGKVFFRFLDENSVSFSLEKLQKNLYSELMQIKLEK